MKTSQVIIGFDRYIAKRWADYALDLVTSKQQPIDPFKELRAWLEQEIAGKEVSRKTANQLHRLWCSELRPTKELRDFTITFGLHDNPTFRPALHYGMAINAFPIFRDTCIAFGRLSKLQGACSLMEIQQRVMEKYPNRHSIPRVINRIFQTLTDWGLIAQAEKKYFPVETNVDDHNFAVWLLTALLISQPESKMVMQDLIRMPEKLGLRFQDERKFILQSTLLQMERDGNGTEVVGYRGIIRKA